MERTEVDKPTMTDVPVELHPPPLVNSVKTDLALFLGARTQIGIIMAKRPTIWMIKTKPSIMGNFLAKKVLKKIEKETMAIRINVPCQRSKTYVGLFRTIKP